MEIYSVTRLKECGEESGVEVFATLDRGNEGITINISYKHEDDGSVDSDNVFYLDRCGAATLSAVLDKYLSDFPET